MVGILLYLLLVAIVVYVTAHYLIPLVFRGSNGFTSATTAEEHVKGISLKDKICIITGGNTGIGLETGK
jgi:hypothetical protein